MEYDGIRFYKKIIFSVIGSIIINLILGLAFVWVLLALYICIFRPFGSNGLGRALIQVAAFTAVGSAIGITYNRDRYDCVKAETLRYGRKAFWITFLIPFLLPSIAIGIRILWMYIQ